MSFLRRRFGGASSKDDSSAEVSREPSPAPGQTRPSNLRVITAEQLHTLKKKGKSKRKNAWIFGLGGLFGLVVAGFFASSNEMIDLRSLENMNLDSILDALPASFVSSAQQLQVSRLARICWTQISRGSLHGETSADSIHSVETRTRSCKLRLIFRGPAC